MRRILTLVALLGILASAPLALAAESTATETYTALRHQIDTGQVVLAYVNEQTNDVRVTLKNGSEQFVVFAHADHKKLVDSLLRHGVKPIYTAPKKAKKPVHHVLRYVAAGIVVVLLLIGAGVWVYTRGERQPPAVASGEPQQPGGADPPGTTAS